jgi:hypothetical protein
MGGVVTEYQGSALAIGFHTDMEPSVVLNCR